MVERPIRWGLPPAVLIVGTFMSVLDVSIVNVAIPTIQKAFGAAADDIQWISTAYSLALVMVVPAGTRTTRSWPGGPRPDGRAVCAKCPKSGIWR